MVKKFLQPTEINVTVENESAMSKVRKELVIVPERIPVGMVVAVLPDKPEDRYWLAQVVEVEEQPLKYRLHFYERNNQLKIWKLMKGKRSHGSCQHGAVIFAGVQFNQNNSMKKDSADKILYALQQSS